MDACCDFIRRGYWREAQAFAVEFAGEFRSTIVALRRRESSSRPKEGFCCFPVLNRGPKEDGVREAKAV